MIAAQTVRKSMTDSENIRAAEILGSFFEALGSFLEALRKIYPKAAKILATLIL